MQCPQCALELPARTDSLRYCLLCNVWYQVDGEGLREMRPNEITRTKRAKRAEMPLMQVYPIHEVIARFPLPRFSGGMR